MEYIFNELNIYSINRLHVFNSTCQIYIQFNKPNIYSINSALQRASGLNDRCIGIRYVTNIKNKKLKQNGSP
jgi:hypothetical protein